MIKIYRACRDGSDWHSQNFEEYGFFLNEDNAKQMLLEIIKEEEKNVKEEDIAIFWESGVYKSFYYYYVEEIKVK